MQIPIRGGSFVAEDLTATMRTTMGTIVLRLFPEQAPKTVQNFVGLAEGTTQWKDPRTGQPASGPLYNGTIFGEVVQGSEVVDAIGKTETDRSDRPVKDVVVESVTIDRR